MNSYLTIILYVVEGSEKMLTFCIVTIFKETFRMEWLRKDVFIFKLTGVYNLVLLISFHTEMKNLTFFSAIGEKKLFVNGNGALFRPQIKQTRNTDGHPVFTH